MNSKEFILLRTVSGLAALFIAVVSAIVFMVALGFLDPQKIGLAWLLGSHYETLNPLLAAFRAPVVIGTFCIGVLAIFLFTRMLSGRQHNQSLHMLTADEQGFVVVDSRGIATIATQAALSAPGVVEAQVRVSGKGNAPIRLRVTVWVYPGANVKVAGDEAREAAREAVDQLVGIGIRDVGIAVKVVEPDSLSTLLA